MALIINNAVLNYVHIKTPALEYKKQVDPKCDYMNKEYIVDVLMPYSAFKKFRKQYKSVGAIEKAKTYTAKEYEAAFKVSPPDATIYGDEDGDFTIVKFRKRAYYKNTGDATKQPQVVGVTKLKNGAGKVVGYKDKQGEEVGIKIAVGNGSVGLLQFAERNWSFGGDKGLNLDLVAIQIQELVPYESADHGFDMDEEEVAGGDDSFEQEGFADEEDDQEDTPTSENPAPEGADDDDDEAW